MTEKEIASCAEPSGSFYDALFNRTIIDASDEAKKVGMGPTLLSWMVWHRCVQLKAAIEGASDGHTGTNMLEEMEKREERCMLALLSEAKKCVCADGGRFEIGVPNENRNDWETLKLRLEWICGTYADPEAIVLLDGEPTPIFLE